MNLIARDTNVVNVFENANVIELSGDRRFDSAGGISGFGSGPSQTSRGVDERGNDTVNEYENEFVNESANETGYYRPNSLDSDIRRSV